MNRLEQIAARLTEITQAIHSLSVVHEKTSPAKDQNKVDDDEKIGLLEQEQKELLDERLRLDAC